MRLIFPGTKGEIEEENSRHKYHTSLIIKDKHTAMLIDFGEKHSRNLYKNINTFDALLITHAHPDHYIWTKHEENSVKIPVYITCTTLNYSIHRPLNPVIIKEEEAFAIKNFSIIAYRAVHSLRCPAVCFKISNKKGNKTIVYAPDILDTETDKETVFKNTGVLVADGSSFNVNLVRRRGDKLFGHAMIKTIINWCKKYGIAFLIVTHCGKQIVETDEKEIESKIAEVAAGKVNVAIAYDGLELEI